MITINATLATGLYWRSGLVLQLGGPLAVLLSFVLLGLLAWAVMQCITEMLCIWPIPGALSVYVSEFVDVELGIAVGVAHWYVSYQLINLLLFKQVTILTDQLYIFGLFCSPDFDCSGRDALLDQWEDLNRWCSQYVPPWLPFDVVQSSTWSMNIY